MFHGTARMPCAVDAPMLTSFAKARTVHYVSSGAGRCVSSTSSRTFTSDVRGVPDLRVILCRRPSTPPP